MAMATWGLSRFGLPLTCSSMARRCTMTALSDQFESRDVKHRNRTDLPDEMQSATALGGWLASSQ